VIWRRAKAKLADVVLLDVPGGNTWLICRSDCGSRKKGELTGAKPADSIKPTGTSISCRNDRTIAYHDALGRDVHDAYLFVPPLGSLAPVHPATAMEHRAGQAARRRGPTPIAWIGSPQ